MKIIKCGSLLSVLATIYFSLQSEAADVSLTAGISVSKENIAQLAATSVPYAVTSSGIKKAGDSGVLAFLNIEGNMLLALSKSLKIHAFNSEKENHLGDWPIVRWPTEADDTNKKIYDMDMGSGFTEEQRWDKPYSHTGSSLATGCLGSSPLRYGDIDGDSKPELVIYAQDDNLQLDWLLFSLDKKTVSFSARLALQDYIPFPAPTATTQNNFPYQFISEEKQLAHHVGIRTYAKIFIDDFDGNGKKDIIVWRKRFHSLKLNDIKKGFALNLEVFSHYESINGVYKKQPTDSVSIKKMLEAKQLTWQKGYPSKSECKGQEGQLIAEMHDPLLNDPDVLK